MVLTDRGRELRAIQNECRSPDPIAIVSTFLPRPDALSPALCNTCNISSTRTDASLTYLRTGRLRL
jgi:hypothetical protein